MSKPYKKVICVDLDDTITNDGYRQRLAPERGSPLDMWLAYHEACMEDTPLLGTLTALSMFESEVEVHIISGRWEQLRQQTEAWLARHDITYDALRMYTPEDRPTKNYVYKVQYLEMLRSNGFEPILFLENEPHVADYIEQHGDVPVLCVNPRYNPTTVSV